MTTRGTYKRYPKASAGEGTTVNILASEVGVTLMTGDIVMFYNQPLASIVAPWYFCDGTNGTPDMRGLTVYGATGDEDNGDTGGAETHSHATGTLAAAAATAGTPSGSISAETAGTPAGTVSSDSAGTPSGTVAWPAGVPTFAGNALAAHDHDYTDVINHTHPLDTSLKIRNSATGSETSVVNGVPDASSTLATGFVTDDPTGGVETGTTTADSAGTPSGSVAWPAGVPTFSGAGMAGHDHDFSGAGLGTHDHDFAGAEMATHDHALSGDTSEESNLGPYIKLGFKMLILEE